MKHINTLNLVRAGLLLIVIGFSLVAKFIAYNIEGYIMCAIPSIVFIAMAIVIKEGKVPSTYRSISDLPNKSYIGNQDHIYLNTSNDGLERTRKELTKHFQDRKQKELSNC